MDVLPETSMTSEFVKSDSRRFLAILLILTVVEAIVVLGMMGQWKAGIQGGDGPGYHQIALNLLKHSQISGSAALPIEPTLFRTPGYPAFLALSYLVSDESILVVRLLQFFLVFLTACLVFRLASLYVSGPTAKVSALLCVTYPPLVSLTVFHLTEVLTTCLSVGLILLVQKRRAYIPGYFLRSACIGLVAGLLALVRPSLSLALPLVFLGIVADTSLGKEGEGVRKSLIGNLVVALAFLLVLSPWLVRNALFSQRFILSTANGESLYFSMLQYSGKISYAFTGAEWQQSYFPEMAKRRDEIDRQLRSNNATDDGISREVPLSVRKELLLNENLKTDALDVFSEVTAWQIIKSLPIRVSFLWSTADFSTEWFKTSLFHRVVQAHFVLIVLFTTIGMFIKRHTMVKEWPLWVFPVYVTAVHLIFHIEPRYSVPARAFILIYAAVGVTSLYEWARGHVQFQVRSSLL